MAWHWNPKPLASTTGATAISALAKPRGSEYMGMFFWRRTFRSGVRSLCSTQVLVIALCGQTTLTFDAASIKKTVPQEFSSAAERKTAKQAGRLLKPSGGPGTEYPERIHYPYISLKELVKSAYAAKEYELAGPGWMNAETFAIDVTMPPSTTKEQFQVMLQNLLAERFKLRTHRESREILTYSLAVAKNGPKLGRAGSIHRNDRSPDGAPLTLPDQLLQQSGPEPGSFTWTGLRVTMNDLAGKLAEETERPVTDATELKEKYDFTLTFRRDAAGLTPDTEALPDIFSALHSIGLRLDAAKRPTEVIVIDHIEKTPTEN
jgi:uncharacterized protein (TIGR03435 family)